MGSAGESTETGASERERIVDAAWDLFREKGYEATTAEDIAERAGVSLSAFHRYFLHKEDLSHTLGELFDRHYSQLLVSMDQSLPASRKLLLLNEEMFRMIEERVPFHLVSHVYVGMQPKEQDVLNENRFYYRLIPRLFEEGIERGEFPGLDSAEEAARTYETLERGLIYDWCVRDGKDSLTEQGTRILGLFLEDMKVRKGA
ncbi:MAG: TetR/AcrR family transcriptional regulator [Lachnospiraceae bacterium]